MAYRDQLRAVATCPICETFKPTEMIQCKNGHLICRGCETNLRAPRCPTCRDPLNGTRCLIIQQISDELGVTFDCPNRCGEQVTVASCASHLQCCKNAPSLCPWGCNAHVRPSTLHTHASQHHAWCVRVMDEGEFVVPNIDVFANLPTLITSVTANVLFQATHENDLVHLSVRLVDASSQRVGVTVSISTQDVQTTTQFFLRHYRDHSDANQRVVAHRDLIDDDTGKIKLMLHAL